MEINILLWIQENLRNPFLNGLLEYISLSGDNAYFWIVVSVLLLFNRKTRIIGILSGIVLLEVLLVNNGFLKNLIARPRPYTTFSEIEVIIEPHNSYSFPSGHTCSSFASALMMYRYLPRKFSIPLLVYASLIAFSRMYFGVHYPSDILGGILIAIILVTITDFAYRKYFRKEDISTS